MAIDLRAFSPGDLSLESKNARDIFVLQILHPVNVLVQATAKGPDRRPLHVIGLDEVDEALDTCLIALTNGYVVFKERISVRVAVLN